MDLPENYLIISALFPRLLGLIFFAAIGAFLFQIKGLIGENGILPLCEYLNFLKTRYPRKRFFYAPTLFWISCNDQILVVWVIVGLLISTCLILGVYPVACLLFLYVLYLSIVSAGQEFLSFGWEGFLLEITLHAFFLSLTSVANVMIWISINLLLFRFYFQAGIVKLQSLDKSWWDLTAIAYHYQTQPLPNTVAWYAHKLPIWFQKLSALIMFGIELGVPFALFGNEEMRMAVFCCFFVLQFSIWLTGNFSFLNHLSFIFSTILLSDAWLSPYFQIPTVHETPLVLTIFLDTVGAFLILLQLIRLSHHFYPTRFLYKLLVWLAPFHVANRYGIFAVMTTHRYEIVVEGSHDGVSWKEYLFKWKPSELNRRPRRISPYQPRIDWQIWFLPFSAFESEKWFQSFLSQLLKNNQEVLSLIRENPFHDNPPKYVRALMYEYEFTTFAEKKQNGCWWKRTFIGPYSDVLFHKHQ